MGWFTERRLRRMLEKAPAGSLEAEACGLIRAHGLPDYIATDPLYFGDVIAAYRAELDRETPIEGLEEVYVAMSRKGGDSILVHNFRDGEACWSLVTSADEKRLYGAMVTRTPIDFANRDEGPADDGRARETRKYGLKAFEVGALSAFGEKAVDALGGGDAELVFLYDPAHPGGREQPGNAARLGEIVSLGKEPVAVEWRRGDDVARVSGSGHRITVVVNAADRRTLETVFQLAEATLGLAAAEFAF